MPAARFAVLAAVLASLFIGTVPAEAAPQANLTVVITDSPDPVTVGDDLTYTIVVTNGGPADATDASVTDTLPAGVVFGSATPSQGSCSAGGDVTCDLGTIAVNAAATVTIVGAPTAPGSLLDEAGADAKEGDPDPSDNAITAQTTAQGEPCTSVGTFGGEEFDGTTGADVLCGLGGDDELYARAGDDVVYGGSGDDVLNGGKGSDTEDGETGIDAASFDRISHGVAVDLDAGTAAGQGSDQLASIEDVIGSPGRDRLWGSAGPNDLMGLGDTDLLFGRDGADALEGSGGDDLLAGGDGNDTLDGGAGTDTCLQGEGTGYKNCSGLRRPDGNDSPGGLDVRVATVKGSRRFAWTIRTDGRWTPPGIWDFGFFVVWIDTSGDDDPDYHIVVRSNSERMVGTLFREVQGKDQGRGEVPTSRPNRHSVSVRLPLGKVAIDRARGYIRWYVESLWTGAHCRTVCVDRVDDHGSAPARVR